MRSLNLDHLRTLAEVVERAGFGAAARRLHLTQPAVSLQIRALEKRCGVRLIERVGRRAFPTAAGQDLVMHAVRIKAEADRALAVMRRHRDGSIGRVHVGTSPTELAYRLPAVLQKLRETNPHIDLVVTTGTTSDITEKMLSNIIDLGLTALPVDEREFIATPIRTDEMVAIFPATENDIPATVTPADLERRTLILEYQRIVHSRLTRAWLMAAQKDMRPALEFDSIEAIKVAVAQGLGMSLIPGPAISQSVSDNNIIVRSLSPPLTRTLGLIQRRDRSDDPALFAVRNAIMTLASVPPLEPESARREPTQGPAADRTRSA